MVQGLISAVIALIVQASAAPQASPQARPSCSGARTARVWPSHGPIGTRVHFRARCFARGELNNGYRIFIGRQFQRPRECELLGVRHLHVHINQAHVARGTFVIPPRGFCFQHDYTRRVTPARYNVSFGCHPCQLTTFRVTRR